MLTILDLPTGDVGAITIQAGSFQIIGDGQIKGTSGVHKGGSAQIETSGDILLNGERVNGAVRLGGNDAGTLGNPIPTGEPKPFCKVKEKGAAVDGVSCKGP